MSFRGVLSAMLGETGELGEKPRQHYVSAGRTKGEFRPGEANTGEDSPRFAPTSPTQKLSNDAGFRPIRPIRPEAMKISFARWPLDPDAERLARVNATTWEWADEELDLFLDVLTRHPPEVQHRHVQSIVDPLAGLTPADFQTENRPSHKTEETQLLPSLETETMLTVSATASSSFEMPPAGPVAARCCRLIDLGTQKGEYQGKMTAKRKILLSWELAELRADETPFQISRRFTLSLDEKATLRQFLAAWRGRDFTPEELDLFDLRKLLNAPCLLNITHTERGGKQYANIASVTPLPKGMTAPDLCTAAVVFDIDAPDAPGVLETLSDNLVATIAASPEWQARIKTAPAGAGFDDLDDVAF